MLDLNLLMEKVVENDEGIIKNKNIISMSISNETIYIDASVINNLFAKIKFIIKTCNINRRIVKIKIHGSQLGDDAVILYLELAVKLLFDKGARDVYLFLPEVLKSSAFWSIFEMSILYESMNKNMLINKSLFLSKFDQMKRGYRTKEYIKIWAENDGNNETASRVTSDTYDYLTSTNCHGFSENFIDATVNIVGEIVDNTMCHTNSDFLLVIKKCDIRKGEKIALSITMANFDNELLYEKIRKKIESNSFNNARNGFVMEAFNNHKDEFDNVYDLDFFSFITAFQKGVTTRVNSKKDSGMGLTRFIKSLLVPTEYYSCYVYSGENILFFNRENIEIKDGMIGFNEENDYLNCIPNKDNIQKLCYFNCGTLYNLILVL